MIIRYALTLCIFLLINSYAFSQERVNYEKAFKEYRLAEDEAVTKNYSKAASRFVKAGKYGFEARQAYMSAIAYYIMDDNLDSAMYAALQLSNEGFRDLRPFLNDSLFIPLQSHDNWSNFQKSVLQNKTNYDKTHRSIGNIVIETSDVNRFWKAFDLAKDAGSLEEKKTVYLEHYFEKGTKGLSDFTFMKMRSGIDDFVKFIEKHREYYEGIKEASSHVIKELNMLPSYFSKIQNIIPDATFTDYYFVIGKHTSFGTVSINGSLIGLENVVDEKTPVYLLPKSRQSVVSTSSFLPFVLIHELIHDYQNPATNTLLGSTITEGAADLITELIIGPPIPTPEYRSYGEANELFIWTEFENRMFDSDTKNWIGPVQDNPPKEDWVRDLSYYIGYRIAKKFYENSSDKNKALQDLLDLKNPEEILKISGYDGSN